jgi:hypothetical protein
VALQDGQEVFASVSVMVERHMAQTGPEGAGGDAVDCAGTAAGMGTSICCWHDGHAKALPEASSGASRLCEQWGQVNFNTT